MRSPRGCSCAAHQKAVVRTKTYATHGRFGRCAADEVETEAVPVAKHLAFGLGSYRQVLAANASVCVERVHERPIRRDRPVPDRAGNGVVPTTRIWDGHLCPDVADDVARRAAEQHLTFTVRSRDGDAE